MKSTLILLALSILASAQDFGPEPSCAIPCISSGISAAGCAPTDIACQCGPEQAKISPVVAACLFTACSPTLLPEIASIGASLCAKYSAGLTATATATGSIMTPGGPLITASSMWNGTSSTSPPAGGTGAGTGLTTSSSTPTKATTSSSSTSTNAAATANAAVNGMGGLFVLFLGAVAAL